MYTVELFCLSQLPQQQDRFETLSHEPMTASPGGSDFFWVLWGLLLTPDYPPIQVSMQFPYLLSTFNRTSSTRSTSTRREVGHERSSVDVRGNINRGHTGSYHKSLNARE